MSSAPIVGDCRFKGYYSLLLFIVLFLSYLYLILRDWLLYSSLYMADTSETLKGPVDLSHLHKT